jgi:bla regulator protein blaR1
MIPVYFTSALANHLWQSTVFAGIAGLLALALRKNHARTRYWLWLIASVKFLIPFSLLAALGGRLGWLSGWLTASRVARPELSVVMEQIGQPFPRLQSPAAVTPAVLAHHASLLPALLVAIWACGFLAVGLSWWCRWRRIRAAAHAASPLDPEIALEADVPVLSTPAMLEPGVFGIFRPVLLQPEGIPDRLAPAHLEAVLAHELCHVRRRDNLAAAVHMAVEAVFWFHPLVWWVGARLVEERERACDEEVLRPGSRPEVYAESVLKTCQFYLESPLVCMSGIAGSDLKKRIVRIMTPRIGRRLDIGRKLLLAAAGIAPVAGPVVFGVFNAPPIRAQSQPAANPAFEVASIKPNHSADRNVSFQITPGGRLACTNANAKMLITMAYKLKPHQIEGAPAWLESERYDITAKAEGSTGRDDLKLMIQGLLADRFELTFHRETKEMPVYALVIGKNGPKLHAIDSGGEVKSQSQRMERGLLDLEGANMAGFADALSAMVGRNVLDRTGMPGLCDIKLEWTPDESESAMFKGAGDGKEGGGAPAPEAAGPSVFTAIQEQLGLKLEAQKCPVEMLMIDHIEKASEN